MRVTIENENKLTVQGKGITVTPTAAGLVIEQPAALQQAALFSEPAKRGRKSKLQTGVETPTGAVPGPPDGDSDRVAR